VGKQKKRTGCKQREFSQYKSLVTLIGLLEFTHPTGGTRRSSGTWLPPQKELGPPESAAPVFCRPGIPSPQHTKTSEHPWRGALVVTDGVSD